MLEGFSIEAKNPTPEKACYIIHSWDGVEWSICWRPTLDSQWVLFAMEKSLADAQDRVGKHVIAQKQKPQYFDVWGKPLNG